MPKYTGFGREFPYKPGPNEHKPIIEEVTIPALPPLDTYTSHYTAYFNAVAHNYAVWAIAQGYSLASVIKIAANALIGALVPFSAYIGYRPTIPYPVVAIAYSGSTNLCQLFSGDYIPSNATRVTNSQGTEAWDFTTDSCNLETLGALGLQPIMQDTQPPPPPDTEVAVWVVDGSGSIIGKVDTTSLKQWMETR